jgi:hypothetical protein
MQTKFKRHDNVIILNEPNKEYIEYEGDYLDNQVPIIKGMKGKINILLPNGEYHVCLLDKQGNIIAYAPFREEDLGKEY